MDKPIATGEILQICLKTLKIMDDANIKRRTTKHAEMRPRQFGRWSMPMSDMF